MGDVGYLHRQTLKSGVWLGERDGVKHVLKVEDPEHPHERMLLSRLDHPHIIQCYGTYQDDPPFGSTTAEGNHYMILEYVSLFNEGRAHGNLEDARKIGPPPSEIVALYAGQLVSALTYLRAQNIVHNDLKSKNVVTNGLEVKLIDFNIARERGHRFHGVFEGTFGYMCLDQVEGKSFFSNDIFGLGATLFSFLEGASPYLLHTHNNIKAFYGRHTRYLAMGPAKRLPRSGQNDVIMGMIEPSAQDRPRWREVQKAFPLIPVPRSALSSRAELRTR